MDCEKILNLFRSELVTVNVGPKLLATALEKQGYKAYQVELKPVAGGDKENAAVISAADSAVTVRVIPANEELGIARRTYEF